MQEKPKERRGLPCNLDAERFVLGAALRDPDDCMVVLEGLKFEDFHLHKHRTMFDAMQWLSGNGHKVDRVTLANRLTDTGRLEHVDGLTYIVSLDDGLPGIPNIREYVDIVREKAALRAVVTESYRTIERALGGAESAAEIVGDSAGKLERVAADRAQSHLVQPKTVIERFGGLDKYLAGRPAGLMTGFRKFDAMTYGLQNEDVFIIAARPSMGKTALALNIAENVTLGQGKTVALFSLEMGNLPLVDRLVCSRARVNSQLFRRGELSPMEVERARRAAHQVAHASLFMSDIAGENIASISAEIRQLKRERGLDLVIVDYLQLLAPADGRRDNRQQEVSDISRGFKLLAKSLKVPFVVLSQLSRATENRAEKRPQMSDLRESGAIEQDADLVAFLFREEIYNPGRDDLKGLAELILAKQRTGPIGTVPLVYLKEYTRFENMADELADEAAA